MTAGWAALNTLRETRDLVATEWNEPDVAEYDAALALVRTALEAAEVVFDKGDFRVSPATAALRDALIAVREGK